MTPIDLLTAAVILALGSLYGWEFHRRRTAESHVAELTTIVGKLNFNPLSAEAYLKELIPLLIDLNPKISAVSKALEKRDE